MKITKIETIVLRIPYSTGGSSQADAWGGKAWSTADCLLVRVETDAGITGWGEAFGYNVILIPVAMGALYPFTGQLLNPSTVYSGQKPMAAVPSGTTPIQPQAPITPTQAITISATPTRMRSARSIEPTFFFISNLLGG